MRTNISIVIVVLILGFGCTDKRASFQDIKAEQIQFGSKASSYYDLDLKNSIVKWKGTKLVGFAHEGTVKFKSGKLGINNGKLKSGEFIVDMTSIYNTDIPLSDPVPRKNITDHLNADFETSLYPEAKFKFSKATYSQNHKIRITGNMTIMDVTMKLTIDVEEEEPEKQWKSSFSINRSDFGIGKEGSWLERKLVNEEIALEVVIQTEMIID